MKKLSIYGLLAILSLMLGSCQNALLEEIDMKDYYNQIAKELSSPKYWGRSLYNDGIFKAADYIVGELQSMGVEPCRYPAIQEDFPEVVGIFGPMEKVSGDVSKMFPIETAEKDRYFQKFAFNYNTLQGDAIFKVDGNLLNPTVDYIFKEFSPTCEVEGEIEFLDDQKAYTQENFVKSLCQKRYQGKFVVVDYDLFCKVFAVKGEIYRQEPYKTALLPVKGPAGIIFEYDSRPPFFKARSSYQTSFPVVAVQKPFSREAKSAYIKLDAQMKPYPARNIIAQIEGKKNPDSLIVFMAHYDHLGAMGRDNIFFGCNDNASGVAMLLSIAKYYSKDENRPDDSMVFVFFDAEEANLLGSWYLAANPTFPLESVKLFLNYDMIGDDASNPEERVVNYQVSEKASHYLELSKRVNGEMNHFSSFCPEDVNDDSDNYPFHIKDLPVLYYSINGKYLKDYHTPRDTFNIDAGENFEALFSLTKECVKQ